MQGVLHNQIFALEKLLLSCSREEANASQGCPGNAITAPT